MKNSNDILIEIKENLITIKKHGGYIDQYDAKLFDLFIEAYKSKYINTLTAESIKTKLKSDNNYCSIKSTYDIDEHFYLKWKCWTEAFDKGFSPEHPYILWIK